MVERPFLAKIEMGPSIHIPCCIFSNTDKVEIQNTFALCVTKYYVYPPRFFLTKKK